MNKKFEEKTWDEFGDSGLGWYINTMLHCFGWSILHEQNEDGGVARIFPARTTKIGFSEEDNEISHKKLKKYMKDYADGK